ncbi:restriction endonuclease [Collinsella provencensis]|uniref:restriction endonuclease n=1 Tax=Collinsella provencensis TaxID=1937461 RepID=UPI000C828086|nr:DEAD/DEAH box helicase family protein [Collinsella provencensis]
MEFKFSVLDYQTRAADAVVNVFDGQSKIDAQSYVRDLGATRVDKRGQSSLGLTGAADGGVVVDNGSGFRNAPLQLTTLELLENVKKSQRKNSIPVSAGLHCDLGAVEIDVEMETGTGKTYVYTKTMFELNARYGWSKFIIVVPSVAIREGVAKSLEITAKHFHEQYGKRLWSFVYNSSRLNEIDSFASRADISVMVINMQAFNAFDESKSKEGRGGDKTARIMFSERDDFGSRRPIDVLSTTNPILIIDEPQKMGKKSGATRKAMQQFKPLFSLNYSATHKERHNTVFALDPLDAYNERLVKRIEVKGIEMIGMRGTDGYVYLQDIRVSPTKPPVAVIEYKKQLSGGKVTKSMGRFSENDNIYYASNELEAYVHGYRILRIVPDQNGETGYVEFDNHERLYRGQIANDSSEEDLRRIQIRETIASHLQKEEVLFRQGIKCLSLFFIDEVAKYRVYDEDGSEGVGVYGRIFEEEYQVAVEARTAEPTLDDARDPRYLRYLRESLEHKVHEGYFSIDKKGRAIDNKLKRGTEFAEGEDAVVAYDLILKDKERLLSFEEPVRFIFSHSALREGWDNPNVFQICTLKSSGDSDISKRQEVGRGLRLCVDQDGTRQDERLLGRDGVHAVNLLTVIASEGYDSFVKSLQSETISELRERPKKVEEKLFTGFVLSDGVAEYKLTEEDANEIMYALVRNGLIDRKGQLTDEFNEKGLKALGDSDIPEHLDGYRAQIESLVRSIEDSSALAGMYANGLGTKVASNGLNDNFRKKEFQELWARINHKHAYTVEFDSNELRRNAVASINKNLTVSAPRYRLKKGAQRDETTREQVESADSFAAQSSKTLEVNAGVISNVAYDLVGEVAGKARITRATAAAILSEIAPDRFAAFRTNPEEFIVKVAALIVDEKARMVVEHIRYNRVAGEYDAAEIFAADMPESLGRALPTSKRGVQNWTVFDSETERKFAQELEESDEVCVFAHLPRSFKIPTPVGDYAPDWAIAFNEGVVKHIYFIAETKGSLNSFSLKEVERTKIECARKLFEQLGEDGVRYDFVSTYDELMDKVMR